MPSLDSRETNLVKSLGSSGKLSWLKVVRAKLQSSRKEMYRYECVFIFNAAEDNHRKFQFQKWIA